MSNNTATIVRPQTSPTTAAQQQRSPKWAKALRTALWTPLAVLAVIGITEGIFALAHIGEEEFVDVHPNVGFWHLPNKQITWRSEGYSQSTTSSDGLRDVDFPVQKPAGVKRIAVTGDSMVEGYQVSNDQTFVKLLADRLKKDGVQAEGMNFGMSGFSTVQALYLFKEKMARYQPDVLVLAYHVGDNEKNQYAPATGGFMPRPHALLENGVLKTDWQGYDIWWNGSMHQQYDAYRWLRANSRLWGLLTKVDLQLADAKWYSTIKKMFERPTKDATPAPRFTSTAADFGVAETKIDTSYAYLPEGKWLYLPISKDLTPQQAKEVAANREISAGWRAIMRNGNDRFAMTGAVIDMLNRACQKNNCKLVVAGLPAPNNSLLYKRELHMMRKLAAQSGFTFVDLNAEFPQIAPMQVNDLYYNVHFTPRGHELVTDILYKHFQQDGLVNALKR
jgi:hypothetical protein